MGLKVDGIGYAMGMGRYLWALVGIEHLTVIIIDSTRFDVILIFDDLSSREDPLLPRNQICRLRGHKKGNLYVKA